MCLGYLLRDYDWKYIEIDWRRVAPVLMVDLLLCAPRVAVDQVHQYNRRTSNSKSTRYRDTRHEHVALTQTTSSLKLGVAYTLHTLYWFQFSDIMLIQCVFIMLINSIILIGVWVWGFIICFYRYLPKISMKNVDAISFW